MLSHACLRFFFFQPLSIPSVHHSFPPTKDSAPFPPVLFFQEICGSPSPPFPNHRRTDEELAQRRPGNSMSSTPTRFLFGSFFSALSSGPLPWWFSNPMCLMILLRKALPPLKTSLPFLPVFGFIRLRTSSSCPHPPSFFLLGALLLFWVPPLS